MIPQRSAPKLHYSEKALLSSSTDVRVHEVVHRLARHRDRARKMEAERDELEAALSRIAFALDLAMGVPNGDEYADRIVEHIKGLLARGEAAESLYAALDMARGFLGMAIKHSGGSAAWHADEAMARYRKACSS